MYARKILITIQISASSWNIQTTVHAVRVEYRCPVLTVCYRKLFCSYPEPIFVNLLRSPGIDSHPGGPVPQTYLTYRPARLHRLGKLIPRNRFLGPLNVYKYGLRHERPAENLVLRFILHRSHAGGLCRAWHGRFKPREFPFILISILKLPLYQLSFLNLLI